MGGKSPGLVFLTAGLSRPFRRLERYAGNNLFFGILSNCYD